MAEQELKEAQATGASEGTKLAGELQALSLPTQDRSAIEDEHTEYAQMVVQQYGKAFGEDSLASEREHYSAAGLEIEDMSSRFLDQAGIAIAGKIQGGEITPGNLYDSTGALTPTGWLAKEYVNESTKRTSNEVDTKVEKAASIQAIISALEVQRVSDSEIAEIGANAEDPMRIDQQNYQFIADNAKNLSTGYETTLSDGSTLNVSPRKAFDSEAHAESGVGFALVDADRRPAIEQAANDAAKSAHVLEMERQEKGIKGLVRKISSRLGRTPQSYERSIDEMTGQEISNSAQSLAQKSGEGAVEDGEVAMKEEKDKREHRS